ncbi:MAG: VIT domain-containing protein [Clostridiaceae bacterium]
MSKSKRWLCAMITVFVLLSLPVGTYAETENEAEDKTLSPYFFVEGADSSVEQFPLKETKVSADICGTIADVFVTQTYTNSGESPINASYVFPASTRASVHGMKMEIGDNLVTAKIKEREEAKKEFEEAKAEGKSASLLEEQRPNVFSMNVANIMPGDTVRIELHYTELIESVDGTCQFVFPTVVGPRYSNQSKAGAAETDKWVESPYLKDGKTPPGEYDIKVSLSTGVPIEDIKCSSHKISIVKEQESIAEVSLADKEEFAGNRDFILDYKLTGMEIRNGLMLYEGAGENFFMLSIQPPERVKIEDIPDREYIFVLDISGSMNGFPIDTAKVLIRNLVSNLRETDKFNLILFAGASNIMSTSSVPATEANIIEAIKLIDQQEGSGGTELLPALERALSLPKDEDVSRSVVMITDGYIDSEKAIFDLIHNNLNKTNFFSFGIGSSVNRYLIEGMAKAGSGEPFVLTDPSGASEIADRFREYVQSPVLTDINVQFDGFDAYDVEPITVPNLFAQRPVILFGKWRGNPSGTIQLSGKTGSGDYKQEMRVSDTKSMEKNGAISYLWARTKIARLSDYGFGDSDDPGIRKEVTSLGLEYSMLTPYTSFIAVIEKIRNTDGKSTDVNQPLPLPLNVSNLAVGSPYTQGAEPGIPILIAGILLMMIFVYLKHRKNGTVPLKNG